MQAEDGFDITQTDRGIALTGALTLHVASALHRDLARTQAAEIDLSGVTRMDTAGAYVLADLRRRRSADGTDLHLVGLGDQRAALLDTVAETLPDQTEQPPRRMTATDRLAALGEAMAGAARYQIELTAYLGIFLGRLVHNLLHPRELRITSVVHHCQEVGLKAVPIVALMAFLIGVVLAFQGSAQLRQFGAEVFVVDLIAISILRELGILLTAIIVAGRTASSFTAAIGAMKMREEIDAMQTLGVNPADALIVPRILALLLMLPILGLIANVMGIFGGALMAWLDMGISPGMFRARLVEDTDVSHLLVGMIKAPVFAVIIGVVGCQGGMSVKGDTESLGRRTSQSVVSAIFTVIVADALFSIFFQRVGM
ncbi:ABC transporter permease [Plastorhodobacter daqingensis]|uniref:ABC transporter permease n=1 Tax=Plastorhodobacter daqingensis TaxID=1387281 RepID=A0ABW2UIS7_9RHOB